MSNKEKVGLPDAMAFYHEKGFVPAFKLASKFAGKAGRVATMPDVIEARLATKPGDIPWENYFTTMTAEYVGRSRGGNRIIIVAHGVGPMATLDGVLKTYSYQFNDKTRNHRGGMISQQEFFDLESGKYGEVSIVDLEGVYRRYKYPFIEVLRVSQAFREPLLKARFGPRAEEYIGRHAQFAREWHKEQMGIDPENRFNLEGHGAYLDRRRKMHCQNSLISSDPFIIQMQDESNCMYGYIDNSDNGKFVSLLERRGVPFAHLISTGRLMNLRHEGNESLVNDISCHAWNNGVRLLGVRGKQVSKIHPGIDWLRNLVVKHFDLLSAPVKSPFTPPLAYVLMKIGKTWFTQYEKKGESMDTAKPEFKVAKATPVGKRMSFDTKIGGYQMFVRYGIKEAIAIMPPNANAYALSGEPEVIWRGGNPEYHRIWVQFYKVEVDHARRVIPEEELDNNYDLMMQIIEKDLAV